MRFAYYSVVLFSVMFATGCETVNEKVSDVANVCERVVPICEEVIEYNRSIER